MTTLRTRNDLMCAVTGKRVCDEKRKDIKS